MKTYKQKITLLLIVGLVLSFSSCVNDKYDATETIGSTAGFDFKTTKDFKVSITTLDNANSPIVGAYIELYTQNPLNEDGTLKTESEKYLIYKGITSADGTLVTQIAPATSVDSLRILTSYIGLPSLYTAKLNSSELNVVLGGSSAQNARAYVIGSDNDTGIKYITEFKKVNDLYAFGSWDNSGAPTYLEKTSDVISSSLLADINASLPEYKQLPVSHPEYFASKDDGSIVLVEAAEVWVTFVHEGASYLNTLAYYSHPTGQAPATKSVISFPTVIFPNVSFPGSGGNLKSGSKVQLYYYDAANTRYTSVFPAGTTIDWALRSNGWTGSTIGNGYFTYYSDARFNPETNESLRKHNVILKDDTRKLLLIGFEDLKRDNGSDNDFNDAVFYASVTPYTAVKSGIYQSIDTPLDTDKDGVTDTKDEYPNDATRAFNNYYPAKDIYGTLAFEDLWPAKGDFDFNDIVVDYNFNQITNAKNQIVAVNSKLLLRANGGSFRDAFGIQFNTTPNNVKSTTTEVTNILGQKKSNQWNFISFNTNGTEKNQSKAVVYAFDDQWYIMDKGNTVPGAVTAAPKAIILNVEFNTPIDPTTFGTAPYNPFIFTNFSPSYRDSLGLKMERGTEVHLPGQEPTSLANINLFGTVDDNSSLDSKKYYMSDKYLPWAINIPVQFNYPIEKGDVRKAFLYFNEWATSKGVKYPDWYVNKTGYRNNSMIFIK
jgi:LruC domain-containing protein